jgi:histidinol-phosphate aminotransferase
MGYQLNDKIKNLKPYDPISGYYPIRLDANESFLDISNLMVSKILEASAFTAYNRYPDSRAADLCSSFAAYYRVKEEQVTAGNGSDELISVIYNSFLMKGDTMMTVSPDFSMYRFYASIVEAKCVEYQKNSDLTIDVDDLIAAAKKANAKMILFSNPCNPTSLGLKKTEVRRLITSVNALVVVDEAYMDFWDESLLEEVGDYDNLIILRTCSKAFAMAGIRLGFAVANPTLTNALKAVKSPYNVNSLTQKIGCIILNEREFIHTSIDKIIASRDALYYEMKRIENSHSDEMYVYPSATNFLFIKMKDSKKMYESLLSVGIAVRFMGDCLRITAGSTQENAELVKSFENAI